MSAKIFIDLGRANRGGGPHTLGAGVLYSEDLNHGQDYDGVRVVNPFLGH